VADGVADLNACAVSGRFSAWRAIGPERPRRIGPVYNRLVRPGAVLTDQRTEDA
jgi:hypothetical protein